VVHRRREYGPFDYEWSRDLDGIELWYAGRKFGEICSPREIHADLKEFGLPARVVQVASVVLGATLVSILRGDSPGERRAYLSRELRAQGCAAFVPAEELRPPKG
jgi:hypothetical protein